MRIRTALGAKDALFALDRWLRATKDVRGSVSGSRFTVRILNGPLWYMPGRGSVYGSIVSAEEGSLVQGSYGVSWFPWLLTVFFLALPVVAVFVPEMAKGSLLGGTLASVCVAGWIWWLVKTDRELLRNGIEAAVRGRSV
jgi:hypothetical protein